MPTVILGNDAPLQVWKPDESVAAVESKPHPTLERSHTIYNVPESTGIGEFLQQLAGGWYEQHSSAPPVFVRSPDEALASVVAQSFRTYLDPKTDEVRDHEVKLGWPKGWPEIPHLKGAPARASGGSRSGKAGGSKNRVDRLWLPPGLEELAAFETQDWGRKMMRLEAERQLLALKVNSGNDLQAAVMGGDISGESGTATASGATSLTTNSATSHAANDLIGHVVVVASATTSAYGVITANTSGVNTVLTVDKWYNPSNPGGAAATTPGATDKYVILPGGQPAFWLAITQNATAPAATDTTLTAEETTGTLARKVATYSHTAGASTYALQATFTNPDATARTINKMGVFNSGPATGGRLTFESAIPSPPVLASSTDTVTVTETVTM